MILKIRHRFFFFLNMVKVGDTYPVEALGALSSPHLKAFGSVGCQWFLIPHILWDVVPPEGAVWLAANE